MLSLISADNCKLCVSEQGEPIAQSPLVVPQILPALVVNGNRLETESGSIVFLNGDAAWSLITGVNFSDAARYMNTRHKQGFNALLVNIVEHYFNGPRNAYGDLPFLHYQNFEKPNPKYFRHVDAVLSQAEKEGMYVLLTPAYVGYNCGPEGWCEELKSASFDTLFNYGVYLGQRYKNYSNLIWVHGGDADAESHGLKEKIKAVAEGIKSVGSSQLHTAHCARNKSGYQCYNWLELDFDTAYARCDTIEEVIAPFIAKYNAQSEPFLFIEGTYENMNESEGCLYEQFIRARLGGSIGHIFGIQPVWDFNVGWEANLVSPGVHTIQKVNSVLGEISLLSPGRRIEYNFISEGKSITMYQVNFDLEGHESVAFVEGVNELPKGLLTGERNESLCFYDLEKLPDLEFYCSSELSNKDVSLPRHSNWLIITKSG